MFLLKKDCLLVECRDHDVLHTVDVCLFYLLEDVGDIGEQDGLAPCPALVKDLQLLDVLKHLVIVSDEFIATQGLLKGQYVHISPLEELGGDHRLKLNSPHVRLALINTHSLKDHANDVTKVLVSQMV